MLKLLACLPFTLMLLACVTTDTSNQETKDPDVEVTKLTHQGDSYFQAAGKNSFIFTPPLPTGSNLNAEKAHQYCDNLQYTGTHTWKWQLPTKQQANIIRASNVLKSSLESKSMWIRNDQGKFESLNFSKNLSHDISYTDTICVKQL